MRYELRQVVEKYADEFGEDAVRAALTALKTRPDVEESKVDVLTIVANAGVHLIPDRYLRGEVFVASQGNWATDTNEGIDREVRDILVKVARKLKERPWRRVFLVPTGHPAVSMNIKLLVYRALRLNTTDWVYLNGIYYALEIDQREIAIEAEAPDRGNNCAAKK